MLSAAGMNGSEQRSVKCHAYELCRNWPALTAAAIFLMLLTESQKARCYGPAH